MRVLITGMSATGKSTLVQELRRRGYVAYDADDDGLTAPGGPGGAWRWRTEAVAEVLAGTDGLVFFAGCSEEQALFRWDLVVLLTVDEPVLVERLAARASTGFGGTGEQRHKVLADLRDVEPLLRRTADLVVETRAGVGDVADQVLARVEAPRSARRGLRGEAGGDTDPLR